MQAFDSTARGRETVDSNLHLRDFSKTTLD